jgi:Phosphodiester glycosidase
MSMLSENRGKYLALLTNNPGYPLFAGKYLLVILFGGSVIPGGRQKWVCRFAALVILSALLHGDFWEQGRPHQPVKIFAGVTYGCERLAVTQEGGGLVHWVRVDLTAPGVELYVTPLDPSAVARGWQYRLRPIEDVVEREHLAVAVNGTYFATASGSSLRVSGDLARSMQTLVSDHVIAYGPWGASLLWFDSELVPHVLQSNSAAEPDLIGAKWAVGLHELQLHNGQVLRVGDSTADARTGIGIDQTRKLLFLAVGERISPPRMLHILADLGAKEGFLLDGGGSSAMAIGRGSTGIPATLLLGSGRPVATYIGVRALACGSPAGTEFCD